MTRRSSRFAGGPGGVLLLLLLCLIMLASCGSDLVHGDEAVLVGTVYLDCSKDCKNHGSCGSSEETGKKVILLGVQPAFPGVSTVAFEGLTAGTAVEVVDTKVVAGVEQRSQEEVEIRFYAVTTPDGDASGWVPGFCVANAAP